MRTFYTTSFIQALYITYINLSDQYNLDKDLFQITYIYDL